MLASVDRVHPDPCAGERTEQEVGPGTCKETSQPRLSWMDVSYGGVTFLVGSYAARDRHRDEERPRREL